MGWFYQDNFQRNEYPSAIGMVLNYELFDLLFDNSGKSKHVTISTYVLWEWYYNFILN